MGFIETMVVLALVGVVMYNLASLFARIVKGRVEEDAREVLKAKGFDCVSSVLDGYRKEVSYSSASTDDEYMITVEFDDHQDALEEFDRKLGLEVDRDGYEKMQPFGTAKRNTLRMLIEYLSRRTYEGDIEWEGKATKITTDKYECLIPWRDGKDAEVSVIKRYNEVFKYKIRFCYPVLDAESAREGFTVLDTITNCDEADKLYSLIHEYSKTGTSVRDILTLQSEIKQKM